MSQSKEITFIKRKKKNTELFLKLKISCVRRSVIYDTGNIN
jgi:hypothetical protein